MVNVLVLFGEPAERESFDEYFNANHQALLVNIPGLERLVVNRIAGAVMGESLFYLILELRFASEDAMQEGLNSEQGQAMARDFAMFASGGVTVLLSQSTSVTLDA